MIISSSLTKQLGAFLDRIGNYGGIELCLTDEGFRPLAKTPRFHTDVLQNAPSLSGAFVRTLAAQDTLSMKLWRKPRQGSG